MKKSLFLLFLVFPLFPCFSQLNLGGVEMFYGAPFFTERFYYLGEETLRSEGPWGIGAGYSRFYDGSRRGFFYQALFASYKSLPYQGRGETVLYSGEDSETTDFLFGLAYRLVDRPYFKIPLGIGFHYLAITTANDGGTVTRKWERQSMGAALFGAVEWHLSSGFYLFARVQGVFDFLLFSNRVKYRGIDVSGEMAYFIDQDRFTTFTRYWGWTPSLGLGLKLGAWFGE
ncbi:MAG: hypothetical protein LBQ61_02685 [Spirochaetales bacterium]|jgi:hypothetical protein|nr:hypothetical protein [Spirochaetales bacterium]